LSRINPCGFAIDLVRRPYSTWMRLWEAPEAPLVHVYWYITTKPFFPYPTVFSSNDWDAAPYKKTGLGEVYGFGRPYDGLESMPGLVGDHICGSPDDFLNGPAWPPVGPPLVYDSDWIPTCCNREFEPNVCACSSVDAIVDFHPPPYKSLVPFSINVYSKTILVPPYASLVPFSLNVFATYILVPPFVGLVPFSLDVFATEPAVPPFVGLVPFSLDVFSKVVCGTCESGTPVVPGDACVSATPVAVGVRWSILGDIGDVWLSMALTPGESYVFDFCSESDGAAIQAYAGVTCADASFLWFANSGTQTGIFTMPPGATSLFMLFFGVTSAGPCQSILIKPA